MYTRARVETVHMYFYKRETVFMSTKKCPEYPVRIVNQMPVGTYLSGIGLKRW